MAPLRTRSHHRLTASTPAGTRPITNVMAETRGKQFLGPWWCRVDSNHRQRDYESRALPPELRHRRSECYLAAWARAFSLRFLFRCFSMATRFLLFIPSDANKRGGLGSKLRRSDSNRRPSGYEPDELPLLHSAAKSIPAASNAPSGTVKARATVKGSAGRSPGRASRSAARSR